MSMTLWFVMSLLGFSLTLASPQDPPQEVPESGTESESESESDPNEQSEDPEVVAEVPAPLPLSLAEYVAEVLARDADLQLDRLNTDITRLTIEESLGAFDPELFLAGTYSNSQAPPRISFTAGENVIGDLSTGLRGNLLSGASYDLTYRYNYQRDVPGLDPNQFPSLNPSYFSDVGLSFTQPLLRGAGSTVAESNVNLNRLTVRRTDQDFSRRVEQKAYSAVQAYWNLVFTLRQKDTAETALEVAQELVVNNRRRLEAGIMTRIDVISAEAEAARRKEELIRANTQWGDAQDILKRLLNPGSDPAQWEVAFLLTTTPQLREDPMQPAEALVELAFDHRHDLRAVETDLRAADLSLEVAENGILPRLDATGTYGLSGRSGKSGSFAVGAESGDGDYENFRKSLEPIAKGDFKRWSAGLDLSYPIGNRTANAQLTRAELEKERAWMNWRILRMNIVHEIRQAWRQVVDGHARTEAAQQARVLAEEQYRAEQVRLDNQHSTTFQVREIQRDLFQAIDQETSALVEYEIRLANLSLAQGILATEYGVVWDFAEPRPGALLD
jgi:outer membrane protein TolC